MKANHLNSEAPPRLDSQPRRPLHRPQRRRPECDVLLVALYMSATPQKIVFNLTQQGFGRATLKTMIASPEASVKGNEVTLDPFGLLIAKVKQ